MWHQVEGGRGSRQSALLIGRRRQN
jgi:hypothetical protein